MRIFNADGSEAMMCGNASRCIGKYLYEKGLTRKDTIRLETLSGVKILRLHIQENTKTVESVTVDMLKPILENPEQFIGPSTLEADGRTFEGTYVCMGNPHFVTFVEDIDTIDIAHYGKILERDKAFPQRCNIEFAQVTDTDAIRERVSFIAPVEIYAGEHELRSLAENGYNVLANKVAVHRYDKNAIVGDDQNA